MIKRRKSLPPGRMTVACRTCQHLTDERHPYFKGRKCDRPLRQGVPISASYVLPSKRACKQYYKPIIDMTMNVEVEEPEEPVVKKTTRKRKPVDTLGIKVLDDEIED